MAQNRAQTDHKKNFWERHKAKIASSLFAVFIWFLIVTGGSFEWEIRIPIRTSVMQNDLIITSAIPKSARIRVRGQGRSLLTFMIFREGRLRLDFKWEIGKKTIELSEEDVTLVNTAKKLTVIELVEPVSIDLQIEKLVSKPLPIRHDITVKPFPGYTIVGDIEIEPDVASIRGPESLVKNIDSISTYPVMYKNLKRPLRRTIRLRPVTDSQITLLDERTTCFVDVQKLMEKRIHKIPVRVTNIPGNVKAIVIPSHFSLVVQGGVNLVAPITEKDIVAFIDYRRYRNAKENDYPAYIEPIPGIEFRDYDPKRFKVILERE